MSKFAVTCSINWYDEYEVEAKTEEEACEKARVLFLKDYGLNDNLNCGLFGVDIECEEVDE